MARALSSLGTGLRDFLGYCAVLRPSIAFGLLIVVLPLAAFFDELGKWVVGNLFVDYEGWPSFWFGTTLFGAVWALMFLTGLSLDAERDRMNGWVHDPGPSARWVTVPVGHRLVFGAFTLLAAPGFASVVLHAREPIWAGACMLLGGLAIFAGIDFAISWLRFADPKLQVLPWPPVFYRLVARWGTPDHLHRLAAPARGFSVLCSRIARAVAAPDYFFEAPDRRRLTGDHVFAAWTALFLFFVWIFLYVALLPPEHRLWGMGGSLYSRLDALPPAGLFFLLGILLFFIISIVWIQFRRYRMTFFVLAAWAILVNSLQSSGGVQGSWWRGHPIYSYDVYRLPENTAELTAADVLAPLENVPRAADGKRNLVIVAASGGGILAAGWTTKVLSELHLAHPPLRRELRLISAVSGGSVGTVHFVGKLNDEPEVPLDNLYQVISASVETSLTAAAYGFAFPDFHRLLLPLPVPLLDRARMQEKRWRVAADGPPPAGGREPAYLSDWHDAIKKGLKPAVILNTTVLESGERVAITPLVSLRHVNGANGKPDWEGWTSDGKAMPIRRNAARTLSEYLLPEREGKARGYTMDVWTAARLSATFSYVSPPAQARLVCRGAADCSQDELSKVFAPLHLIDGGYHENYGVASALDWLTRTARWCLPDRCPFDRVALIEIRAKPESLNVDAEKEWMAAWLGPAVGLLNSWAFAQTSANDTSVDRLIRRAQLADIPFESFVFVPESKGRNGFPLSWHLSEEQKEKIYEYWRDPPNQQTLRAFLRYVNCGKVDAPCPPADELGGGPDVPFEGVPLYDPSETEGVTRATS